VELQTDLVRLGYDIGPCGIDGDFGRATKAAVEQLQLKHGLVVDGICGPKTWVAIDQDLAALDQPAPIITYTVTIPDLSMEDARKLCDQYPKALISEGSVAR
jgi:peptidoglycan hydrolase-like protein with peptidoglycan-binding domain